MALVHKHLIIRAEVKNPPQDEEESKSWISNLVEVIDMKILMGPYSKYVNKEGNRGLTTVAIIETSHIALHTWDENTPALMQLDVYTCGPIDPQVVVDQLNQFGIIKAEMKYLDRETELVELTPPVKITKLI